MQFRKLQSLFACPWACHVPHFKRTQKQPLCSLTHKLRMIKEWIASIWYGLWFCSSESWGDNEQNEPVWLGRTIKVFKQVKQGRSKDLWDLCMALIFSFIACANIFYAVVQPCQTFRLETSSQHNVHVIYRDVKYAILDEVENGWFTLHTGQHGMKLTHN